MTPVLMIGHRLLSSILVFDSRGKMSVQPQKHLRQQDMALIVAWCVRGKGGVWGGGSAQNRIQ